MRDDLKSRYGDWCLIAGAAEGLGEAFSMALGKKGLNLIMADYQKDKMEALAQKLESSQGIKLITLHLDLASKDSAERLMEAIRVSSCRLIIYNAAYSRVQKFLNTDPDKLDRYIQVNMRTPLQLIHAFCSFHSEKLPQKKGILLMSSLAGSWGTRLLGPYGGSKAFNHILAESLYYEMKEDGFDVLACVAGATATPAYLASLPQGNAKTPSTTTPEAVALAALNSLGKRPFVVPGFRNKLTYFLLSRLLPRRTSLKIMNRAVASMYCDHMQAPYPEP